MTPCSRATSTVRSVEPSSMTSTMISSMPGICFGIDCSTSGSVSSSFRHGTCTTSLIGLLPGARWSASGGGRLLRFSQRPQARAVLARKQAPRMPRLCSADSTGRSPQIRAAYDSLSCRRPGRRRPSGPPSPRSSTVGRQPRTRGPWWRRRPAPWRRPAAPARVDLDIGAPVRHAGVRERGGDEVADRVRLPGGDHVVAGLVVGQGRDACAST